MAQRFVTMQRRAQIMPVVALPGSKHYYAVLQPIDAVRVDTLQSITAAHAWRSTNQASTGQAAGDVLDSGLGAAPAPAAMPAR
jgi:hypothetical protein